MDDKLKQRLVGAVIIVALAVIFVPMLFDGSGTGYYSSGKDVPVPPDLSVNHSLPSPDELDKIVWSEDPSVNTVTNEPSIIPEAESVLDPNAAKESAKRAATLAAAKTHKNDSKVAKTESKAGNKLADNKATTDTAEIANSKYEDETASDTLVVAGALKSGAETLAAKANSSEDKSNIAKSSKDEALKLANNADVNSNIDAGSSKRAAKADSGVANKDDSKQIKVAVNSTGEASNLASKTASGSKLALATETALKTSNANSKVEIAASSNTADLKSADVDKVATDTNKGDKVEAKSTTDTAKIALSSKSETAKADAIKLADNLGSKNLDSWSVRLGTFSNRDNAVILGNKLQKKGYRAYLKDSKINDSNFTLVYVGPELEKDKATEIAKKLRHDYNLNGVVVAYKPTN